MNYKIRKPCAHCPFRSDIPPYLRAARVEEIGALLVRGGTFICHETTGKPDVEESHCAGSLLVLEREYKGRGGCMVNQMARWMQRLGLFDPDKLDAETVPVYASISEMAEACDR